MTDEISTPTLEAPTPEAVPNATDDVSRETTNPIKTSPEQAPAKVEVVEPKKPSVRDALKLAQAKVNAADQVKVVDPKAVDPKDVKPAEKVVAKPDTPPVVEAVKAPHAEPPKRFNDAEKAEWEKAPDTVKQGIHRAVKEMETGLEKHRAQAAKYEELKEYEEMAAQYKTTIKDALKSYTAVDKALQSQDPQEKLRAIEHVLSIAKVSPKDYAAFISQQPVDQVASRDAETIRQLQQQVHQLSQSVNSVNGNMEQQQRAQMEQYLTTWAADKPLANNLAPQIAAHVQQGLSLDEAYGKAQEEFQEMARSAGFIPQSAAPEITPAVHTLKGQKSIAGAPGPGSFPATNKPSGSVAEAVRKAFAAIH